MIKSRTALILLPVAAFCPSAAFAEPAPVTAEEAIAAYEAEFDAVMASARTLRRCPRRAEDIVVCARSDDAGMRVPYEPVSGEVHRIAGDRPRGDVLAADVCLRLCHQPLTVDIEKTIRFLSRGVDRLLHPD
jgi:hypothetical protein